MTSMFAENEVHEKYKDYSNRIFERHKNKLKDTIQQIKQCSLKKEDKKSLIKVLIINLSFELNE